MNFTDLLARFKLLKTRLPALFKKYPVVGAAMLFVGILIGFVLGKLF